METLFKHGTEHLANGIEVIAAVLIALAVVEATVRVFWLFLHLDAGAEAKEVIRLRLGRWLALALEFELAADIIRTAVAPTWSEIGQLGAIVVIRTVLNFFLQRDIDKAASQEGERAQLRPSA